MNVTSRYQSNPDEEHWIAVKNIIKYLKRTKNLFLIFGGGSKLQVESYSDSDFMSNPDNRKSTSGYVLVCNSGAVSWKSFKQPITVIRLQKLSTSLLWMLQRKVFSLRSLSQSLR